MYPVSAPIDFISSRARLIARFTRLVGQDSEDDTGLGPKTFSKPTHERAKNDLIMSRTRCDH